MKSYTTRDVAKLLGLSEAQVRSQARVGYLAPDRGPHNAYRFSFQDLVLLRTARALSEARIAPRRIRRALRALTLELPAGRLAPAEAHVARLFAAQDFLAAKPDLLEGRFAFAAGVAVEQRLEPQDGWIVRETTLVASQGIGFRIGLDTNSARIVTALRPNMPLGEVLDGVADAIGADREAVSRAATELVRKLIELALLVPVSARG